MTNERNGNDRCVLFDAKNRSISEQINLSRSQSTRCNDLLRQMATQFKKVYPIAVAEWLARLTAVREDPGSNHTADGCVYRDSRCDIQPWAQAVHLCCSA